MDTESFIINTIAKDFYIEDDVEKRFDTSNFEINIPSLTKK